MVGGIRDHYPDGRGTAGHVGLLTQDVDDGHTQDLRERIGAVQCGLPFADVGEAIAHAMPSQVLDGQRVGKFEVFLPGSVGGGHVDAAFRAAEHVIFGVEDFDQELSRARARRVVGDGDVQAAVRIGSGNRAIGLLANSSLVELGTAAAEDLDEKNWLNESQGLAENLVYDAEVSGGLRNLEAAHLDIEHQPLDLSEDYLRAGADAAEKRVVQAGFRLGAILKQLFQ